MRSIAFLTVVLAMTGAVIAESPTDFAVVGYLPSYRVGTFRAAQAKMLTDLVLFSVEPKRDGSLNTSRVTPEVVATVDRRLKGTNVRKLLTVGGWGKSEAFAHVTGDDRLRAKFVAALSRLCDRYQLDGVDVDWEHPASDAEHQSYAAFLQELRDVLKPKDRILTVAVAPWRPLLPEALAAVDRVHLMAYDHGGRHSTYSLAVDSIEKLLVQGVPPHKICLGIPFYGRPFEGTFGKGTMYAELVRQFDPPPDENEAGGLYYNGPELVARKVRLARHRGLGGVMIWEIGQDARDPQRSLLHAIHQAATTPVESTP